MLETQSRIPPRTGFHLTDPLWFAQGDPHALFTTMRAEAPIFWTEGHLDRGFWSLFRYQDTKTLLMNDHGAFSVQQFGASLPANEHLQDPETSPHLEMCRQAASISVMDGEPHAQFRSALQATFSPGGVRNVNELINECMDRILGDVLPRGECDFTSDLAGMLPLMVIARMMDIPWEDTASLYRYNNMIAAPDDAEWSLGDPQTTVQVAMGALMEYLTKLARERRGKDGNDLLTLLANTRLDGVHLTDVQLGFNAFTLFAAGHETTRASLSAGFAELVHSPDQFAALRSAADRPAAITTAAEEFVRWSSPLTHTLRTATEDFVIGGQKIAKGDWVVPWFGSANRDEEAFENAGVFDAARKPNNHLGFAAGKHFCLGAHLARAEMKIAIASILDRMSEIEITGPIEYSASNLFWGIKHLPIRFKAR